MAADLEFPTDDQPSIFHVVRVHGDNDVVLKVPVAHIQHYSSCYHVGLLRLLGWVLTGVLGEVTARDSHIPLSLNCEVRRGEHYRYVYEGSPIQLNLNYFVARRNVVATDDRVIDLGVDPSASSECASTFGSEASASPFPYMPVADRDTACIFTKLLSAGCARAHIVPRKLKGCDGLDAVLRRVGIEALDAVNNRLLLHMFIHESWDLGDVLLLATDTRFIPAVPPAPGFDWGKTNVRKLRKEDFTTTLPTAGDETWSIHYQELPDCELRTDRIRDHPSPRDRVEMLQEMLSMAHNRTAEFSCALSVTDAPSRDALHMLYGVALIRRYLFRGGGTLSFPIWDTAPSVSNVRKRRSRRAGSSWSNDRSSSRKRLRVAGSPPPPPPPPETYGGSPNGSAPLLNAYNLHFVGAETERERERRLNQWVRLSDS